MSHSVHGNFKKIIVRSEGSIMSRERPKYRQIIEGAIEVIAENGFHASQVSKIAKKANVADGTIYLYFKNKEDILISVFKDKMGYFEQETMKAIQEHSSAKDKLATFIRMHYTLLSASPYLAIVTQLELRQSNPELRHKINDVLKDYLDIIDMIVKQGMEDGDMRKDIDSKLIRQMIFGTLDETVTTWVMKSQRYSLVDQVEDVHQLLVHGLFTARE